MPLDFPTSPAPNEIYTYGGRSWQWNGTAWDSYSPVTTITTLNGLTGTVGITAGSGMGVTVSGQNIVLSNTGVLSFNGLTGAVTGVTTGTANTFGPVQSFNGGIVASGATLTGNVYITGLTTPSVDSQAANKAYVDSVASVGIHYHTAVALASTDSETFNTGVTYDNGASGVGATLRKTASFARINIDSTDGSTGDRILIRSAATQQWNGVYSVTNQGSGSTGWILTRTTDADNYHPYENDGLGGNDYFFVTGGSSLKNNAYICSNAGGITFGTTAITFAIFSTPPVYTAGTGLALNSLQFSNTGVLSFNGSTGSITGVSSVRGLTGAIGITNGSGIGLSVSGQTMTFSNTGVLSIDGGTGAITNVARTNVSNIFTADQLISAPFTKLSIVNTVLGVTSEYSASNITHYSGTNTQTISFNPTNPTNTITLPNVSTTLAGLAAGQTFTQVNTFNALTNFPGGISAAGATFSSLVRFNAGISAAGGTFSSQARFLSGITVAGGATFATDISVNGMRVGRGAGNQLYNVALGAFTLTTNTIGNYNLAIGAGSLELNIDGTDNIALGYGSLNSNSSGLYNVGVGSSTLIANSSGSNNSAIGVGSLGNISTGNDNVGIGYYSLGAINLGRSQNTAIGSQAGYYRGSASSTLLGATGGIYIGYQSRASANAQTNEIVIGTQALGLGSNTAVIGATSQTAATIYGLLNATSGISAPGGTFSALTRFTSGISAAGGTFSGTQTFVNGATFSSGINITGNVTASGALIGYQQINAQTGTTYTAVLSDVSKLITLNNASGITMTIPLNSSVAFPTGTVLYFAQLGVGQVGFTGASGVTLNFTPGRFLRTQYSTASAIQLSTNIWLLSGDLTA